MQLVGATNWTIRWPFVLEGILSGFFGALAGIALLWGAYRSFVPRVALNLPFVPFRLDAIDVQRLAIELIIVGAVVGMLASALSVGRYLKAA